MKHIHLTLAMGATLVAILTLSSCREGSPSREFREEKNDTTGTAARPGAPLNIRREDTISEATLTAINRTIKQLSFIQLMQYLPETVEGFTVNDAINGEDGSIGKSGARYFSFANKEFNRQDQKIRVEIIDYTPDTVRYKGLLKMYGFDSDLEDNVLRTKKIDLKISGTKAVAIEYKTENTAKVMVGAAGGVLIVITGIQVNDLNLLQKVAGKIDYKKMAVEADDVRKALIS